jgi:hypothetical protein
VQIHRLGWCANLNRADIQCVILLIVCLDLALLAVFFDLFQRRLGVFLGLEQLLEALRGLINLL